MLSLKAFLANSLSALGVTFGLISQNWPFFGSTSIIETMSHLLVVEEDDKDDYVKTGS